MSAEFLLHIQGIGVKDELVRNDLIDRLKIPIFKSCCLSNLKVLRSTRILAIFSVDRSCLRFRAFLLEGGAHERRQKKAAPDCGAAEPTVNRSLSD